MRAAHLEWWPALMTRFHLMPWDVGRLSRAELDQLKQYIEDEAWGVSHG